MASTREARWSYFGLGSSILPTKWPVSTGSFSGSPFWVSLANALWYTMACHSQESPSERIFEIRRVEAELRPRDGCHFKMCVTFFDTPRYPTYFHSFSFKFCTLTPCPKVPTQNKKLFQMCIPRPETNFRAFDALVVESRGDLHTISESSPRRTFWYTTLKYFSGRMPTNATS